MARAPSPREEAANSGGGKSADRRPELAAARRATRAAIARGLLKALPYGVQLAASSAAYQLGITAAQVRPASAAGLPCCRLLHALTART
jgi:hypothetical protein